MDSDKRVLIGMSGGIDSSAACMILQEQGYEVIGLTMRMWDLPRHFPNEGQTIPQFAIEAKELAEKLNNASVTVSIKAGEGGRAFGAVSSKEIEKAAKDQLGLEIDKKKIVLNTPIKAIGSFEVSVKLHKEVTAKLAVKVVEA